MPETFVINSAIPRIGVFCYQQQPWLELLVDLQLQNPQWMTSSFDAVQPYLTKQPVDIVLCLFTEANTESIAWIRAISAKPDLFVIVMVSEAGVDSAAVCLEAGAERCLCLPLDQHAVLANISKSFRHLQILRSIPKAENTWAVQLWKLNCQQWELMAPSGLCMPVTKLEMRFLQILMAADGELIPRMLLAGRLYINKQEHEFQRMEMLISRLRKKARVQLQQELPIKSSYAGGLAFIAKAQIAQV